MSNNINFTFESKKNAIIFRFEGEFTNDNAVKIFEDVKKVIIEKGHSNAIINLGKIQYINSRAAGGIANIYETIEVFLGKIYITDMNDFVKDTLELLGMFLFINMADTEEKALIELSK